MKLDRKCRYCKTLDSIEVPDQVGAQIAKIPYFKLMWSCNKCVKQMSSTPSETNNVILPNLKD